MSSGGPESKFWQHKVRKPLFKIGVATRIENVLMKGTPDVNYALARSPKLGGWIELKVGPAWPKRADTKYAIRHYTVEQRQWARNWRKFGGTCWFLLLVPGSDMEYGDDLELAHEGTPGDILLFRGHEAADLVGEATKAEFVKAAVAHWTGAIDHTALERVLREG